MSSFALMRLAPSICARQRRECLPRRLPGGPKGTSRAPLRQTRGGRCAARGPSCGLPGRATSVPTGPLYLRTCVHRLPASTQCRGRPECDSAWAPARCRMPAAFLCWQWHTRLETLQLDSRASTGPQQAICGGTQPGSTLQRVISKSSVKRCEKSRDVLIDPLTQRPIDERTGLLRLAGVPRCCAKACG